MSIIIIILIIVIVLVALNLATERTKAKTFNTQKTETLYKINPNMEGEFLEIGNGNVQAFTIIQRLANLGYKLNEVMHTIHWLDIKGYKLEYIFRAAKKDIMQVALILSSPVKTNEVLRHIEQVKYSGLPSTDAKVVAQTLTEYDYDSIDELIDSINPNAYRAVVSWQILVDILKPTDDIEQAIMNFLVPDNVNAAQWMINFMSLNDWTMRTSFEEHLPENVKNICDNPIIGYPNWFIAGYSHVVMWLNKGDYRTSLNKKTILAIEETANEGAQFNLVVLRMICNDYELYQAQVKERIKANAKNFFKTNE